MVFRIKGLWRDHGEDGKGHTLFIRRMKTEQRFAWGRARPQRRAPPHRPSPHRIETVARNSAPVGPPPVLRFRSLPAPAEAQSRHLSALREAVKKLADGRESHDGLRGPRLSLENLLAALGGSGGSVGVEGALEELRRRIEGRLGP